MRKEPLSPAADAGTAKANGGSAETKGNGDKGVSPVEGILRDIRSDIVESRNLTIKTDNLVKNLNADVREIGKRQELFEKRVIFNSVGAYLLYSIIIFVGLYLVFQAQVAKERDAVVAAQTRISDLQGRVTELEGELERRRGAEEGAYTLYQLMEEGKEEDVLTKFPNVRGTLVNRAESELLRKEVDRINREIAEKAFLFGRESYDKRDYETARDAFSKSTRHVEKTHYTPKLRFMLGMSQFALADYEDCVDQLKLALDYPHDRNTMNEAVYHLAVALDKLGRLGEARTAYELYARRFAYDKRAAQTQKRVFQFIREGISAEGEIAGFTGADAESGE